MVRLEHLHKAMRPQFVWLKEPTKPLQLNEEYEGAKDLARIVFVGIADMYGFDANDVMDYLDMEYDSHRNKIQQFRSSYREALRREDDGSIYMIEDPVKKFYLKVCLTLNAIKWQTSTNPYLKIGDWITHE